MVETHTRILGIAPYDGMRTAMEQAAQAYPNVELEVYTGDLEEGQAIVQRMAPNSYDCIISRGGTATLIRQVTDLPVVDIHISVYDVLRTMKLAENYTSLYAIVGFPSITEPAHTLCSLLNFDLDILTVRSAEEVRHTLERLKQGGYRMVVNEESSNVSQGQKQLLTIARAILADPRIMILDEATSSVDTRTEVRIQKGMDESMKGRTSFIIAHRLSTIRNADLILVMRDGDIVEQGTHEELMEKGGFYREIYQAQFSA